MRKLLLYLVPLAIGICQSACTPKKTETKQEYWDKLTVRTMGLAFLEENKLPEAEEQFKKLTEIAPAEPLGFANLGLVYLRMARFDQAEKNLDKALTLKPDDPDIALIQAKVYELTNRVDKARTLLQQIIKKHQDHMKSITALADLEKGSEESRASLLIKAKVLDPANIVVTLDLIQVQMHLNQLDSALSNMESLEQIMPQLPDGAAKYFKQTKEQLQSSEEKEAEISLNIFKNSIKLTNIYQKSLQDLKGPGGPLLGFPILTFDQSAPPPVENESILEAMKFTDATVSSGLSVEDPENPVKSTGLAIADFDGDDQIDVFFGRTTQPGKSELSLFKNDIGLFTNQEDLFSDLSLETCKDALFSDINNDGHLDLLIADNSQLWLMQSNEEGGYEKKSIDHDPESVEQFHKLITADLDQDGDLDILALGNSALFLFRNNLDGTFTEMTGYAGLAIPEGQANDVGMADFDDDGDLDLVVASGTGGTVLFANQRQSHFENVTTPSGLDAVNHAHALAVGDYNNDGFSDLCFADNELHTVLLFKNTGGGVFTTDGQSKQLSTQLWSGRITGLQFVDVDNDGHLDLLASGQSEDPKTNGIVLFHNDGKGNFTDASQLIPSGFPRVNHIALGDYNEDGDLDIFLTTAGGQVHLLRNDGGNANHYLKVQLVGLRSGSGKNNHFGIGAKVEVRAAGLYQMKTITSPNTNFGLGSNKRADVIRILWTNGVPQNIFSPQADAALVENQVLKGSCPFLYTWNGHEFVFVKDVMWKSALGMPLGIMAGETQYAFPNASQGYIKIPGSMLKPNNGKYELQITAELWETIYLDKVRLVAVDHPDSIDITVNERFSPPPFPELQIYKTTNRYLPKSIADEKGRNLKPFITKEDDRYIPYMEHTEYQGIAKLHDLIIDIGSFGKNQAPQLYLNGWIFPTDASINVALSQNHEINLIAPYLEVKNKNGDWEKLNKTIGFPLGKDKTVIVDLKDVFKSDDHRLRLRTNMEIYWDHIYLAQSDASLSSNITELAPVNANLHYRGYSRMFRKGGRYGPHWFDYSTVSKGQRWRDLIGSYTRFGNVTELVKEADDQYVIANAGDEVTLIFNADASLAVPAGWTRDFLIYTEGWVKDGDLNTAESKYVAPLPFHGMSRYPYRKDEHYPLDKVHKHFIQTYNSREVDISSFRTAIQKSQ